MSTPSSTLYVHPGWASVTSWSYAGASFGSSAVTAVAFDVNSSLGQSLSRGTMQYSADHGQTWTNYTAPSGGQGSFVSVANTVWRFQDLSGSDDFSANTFSAHYQLANGSVVEVDTTVMVDDQPVGVVNGDDTMFSTMHAGDVVDTPAPIDNGDPNNGRWVIDSQSQPGLFSISYNPATDSTAKLVIADPSQLPASGAAASVTAHYYDPYQIDTNGNPIPGQGASATFSYTVQDGATNDLAGFTFESRMGAATDAWHASPALATLSTGGYVAVWQGLDTVAGGAGAGLWAQLRDAGGNALGTAFALTPNGDAKLEGQPAVAALAGGGYVVSWGEMNDGNVYASVAGSPTSNKPAFMVSSDGDAASISTAAPLPHVTALAGGGYVVAWDSYANDLLGFSESEIFFQVYDGSGHAAGSITQANVDSGGGRYDAEVAALSDGRFVVTWEGSDFDGNGIFGRRFGVDGSALDGHEFAINQLRAGDQSNADVTALAGGGFASAWVDSAVNGSVGIETRVLPPMGGSDSGASGNSGGDVMTAPGGNAKVDGGDGLDTLVFSGGSGFTVLDAEGNQTTLANVERLQFSDQMVALDIDGIAGQAYRLYQAAFDRTPDKGGLGFWIAGMDKGETLLDAAKGFIDSKEFADLYGANANDAQFVDALYQNVLHRTPDQSGYDFWMRAIQIASRAEVLTNFSESAENQTQVIGSIQNGIAYLHWG